MYIFWLKDTNSSTKIQKHNKCNCTFDAWLQLCQMTLMVCTVVRVNVSIMQKCGIQWSHSPFSLIKVVKTFDKGCPENLKVGKVEKKPHYRKIEKAIIQ